MRSTCRAVAQVWINGFDQPFFSYEEIPVSEYENPYVRGHGLTTPQETIWWNRDGTTKRIRKNDTTIWWAKPTLSDAITNTRKGETWQFFKDGSVYVKDEDGEWFWSEDYEVESPRRTYWSSSGYLCSDYKIWYSETMDRKIQEAEDSLDDLRKSYDSDSCGCNNHKRCCGYDSDDAYRRD